MQDTIVVFDHHSKADIIASGGSEAWKLNRANALKCRYLVCTRNAYKDGRQGNSEEQRAAFLIAKISDIVSSPTEPGRFVICFDEYAEISERGVWPENVRNPVRYMEIAKDLKQISLDGLAWKRVAAKQSSDDNPSVGTDKGGAGPLTIREAKERLALTFGVSPDAIEIHIRG